MNKSPEGGHQPSPEEIQKAEEMMSFDEKIASAKRESEEIDKRLELKSELGANAIEVGSIYEIAHWVPEPWTKGFPELLNFAARFDINFRNNRAAEELLGKMRRGVENLDEYCRDHPDAPEETKKLLKDASAFVLRLRNSLVEQGIPHHGWGNWDTEGVKSE